MKIFLFLILCLTACGSATLTKHEFEKPGFEDEPLNISSDQNSLQIFIINVGQGDATLVLGPLVDGQRTSLLIDAGALDPNGGEIIRKLFEEQNIKQLDYLILSHFDSDHMGGLVHAYLSSSFIWNENCEPTEYFPKKAIYDLGNSDKQTETVLEYLQCRDLNSHLLEEGHIVVSQNEIGSLINLKNNFTAQIVTGDGFVLGQNQRVENVDTDNESSIAVYVSDSNDFGFLVMGDLTGQVFGNEDALVEEALADSFKNPITILRTGHHGSLNASSPYFLEKIQPEVSIISVGENSHGHPHCEVLENLLGYSDSVLQTNVGSTEGVCSAKDEVIVFDRTIKIKVSGEGYEVDHAQ